MRSYNAPMSDASREAFKRFIVAVLAMISLMTLVVGGIMLAATWNGRLSGSAALTAFVLGLVSCGFVYWYFVFGRRWQCSRCSEPASRLVWRGGEYQFVCPKCGNAEPTGWDGE